MASSRPKFSLIVPTRERCDTLVWTLKACLEQDRDDVEIVVSDNLSLDGTGDAVRSIDDPRLKYFQTEDRLSMNGNYEFAISKAKGEYLTIIGDDDAMVPNSLDDIAPILDDVKPLALTWKKAFYTWKNYQERDSSNVLSLPAKSKHHLTRIDADKFLKSLVQFNVPLPTLIFNNEFPAVYHGFVHCDVIDKARSRTGRFFNSRIPDLYSGIAVASVIDEFWHSDGCYSVRGASAHSIGGAQFGGNEKDKSPAKQFLAEADLEFHPDMAFCYNLPIMVVESLLQVRDNVPNARKISFDPARLIEKAMAEAVDKPRSVYEGTVGAVRHISKRFDLVEMAEEVINSNPRTSDERNIKAVFGYNPFTKITVMDGDKANIDNVCDAAKYCETAKERSVAGLVADSGRFFYEAVTKKGFPAVISRLGSHLNLRRRT